MKIFLLRGEANGDDTNGDDTNGDDTKLGDNILVKSLTHSYIKYLSVALYHVSGPTRSGMLT